MTEWRGIRAPPEVIHSCPSTDRNVGDATGKTACATIKHAKFLLYRGQSHLSHTTAVFIRCVTLPSVAMADAAAVADPYRKLIDALSGMKKVLVTTHVRPDGDALGTSAALVLGMRKNHIDAEVLLLSRLPTKYSFIFKDNGIVYHDVEKGFPADWSLDRYDALLVADTGTWSQLPGLREQVEKWPK